MKILVGYTGLIGKTLSDSTNFDFEFNSSNLDEFSSVPDNCDLYLACLPATMWAVNSDLLADTQNMLNILKTLKTKKFKNVYLFSTIAVYCDSPKNVDEGYFPFFTKTIYGSNRHLFEMLVKDCLEYETLKIFRLPALFGKHLKKNIFFDLMNNHQVDQINTASVYQWYNLANLWQDIQKAKTLDGQIFNFFSEPVETEQLLTEVFQVSLDNKKNFKNHNFKTIHSETGFWETKENILNQMKEFLNENRS